MAGLPRRYTETHRPEAVDPVDLFGSIDRAFDRMLEVRLGRSPSAKQASRTEEPLVCGSSSVFFRHQAGSLQARMLGPDWPRVCANRPR